jgi:hypothetical protein
METRRVPPFLFLELKDSISQTSEITSANLTGYEMEKSIEARVLITGGSVPVALFGLFKGLVDTHVIERLP